MSRSNNTPTYWIKSNGQNGYDVIPQQEHATLRDKLAMAALTGLVNRLSPSIEADAREAYAIADAMLKAREER